MGTWPPSLVACVNFVLTACCMVLEFEYWMGNACHLFWPDVFDSSIPSPSTGPSPILPTLMRFAELPFY